MGVVTGRGDGGKTSLFPKGMVAKDDLRIELVGTLDELTSFLGVVRSLVPGRRTKAEVAAIQREIFWLSAEAVTPLSQLKKLKRRIAAEDVARLEKALWALEKRAGRGRQCFKTPGKDAVSALFHVCRALCRRAERRLITLKKKNKAKNPAMFRYINRLSDLLFLMAQENRGRR